jgi:hypothetical protein
MTGNIGEITESSRKMKGISKQNARRYCIRSEIDVKNFEQRFCHLQSAADDEVSVCFLNILPSFR